MVGFSSRWFPQIIPDVCHKKMQFYPVLSIAKASNDLLNADNNLYSEKIPYDTVCFHCQQAAEKLLKAYLACIGQSPPVTHDLLFLLERILPSSPEAERLRDHLALLMPYAVEIYCAWPETALLAKCEDRAC